MFRPSGERWWVTGGRWPVAGSPGRAGPQFVCTALTGPACGGQAEKLLVRHTNTTPPHPRCDGKSAEALESKGVVERPLRKRVRKMKKEKGIDENGARKLQMRDFVRWPPRRAGDWPFAKGAPRQDRGKLGKRG